MQERLRELNKNLPPISLGGEEPRKQLQKMAWGVPTAVYLLFNAMAALAKEAVVTVTPPITAQQSNWTVNKTAADFREGLMALKFSHPCLEEHDSYCINGVCLFHHELEKVICRIFCTMKGNATAKNIQECKFLEQLRKHFYDHWFTKHLLLKEW
ncbi:epigen isoform X4 [Oryctolagus cuniculus]|uniref:Epithelial mitogen n=1 Tax=Oryctolagus cuniculus TaxID=9986 RepID=A0A5F9CVH9_RABIT|nr:epigen isoform X5 [Oryctolagus cuniculus]